MKLEKSLLVMIATALTMGVTAPSCTNNKPKKQIDQKKIQKKAVEKKTTDKKTIEEKKVKEKTQRELDSLRSCPACGMG